MNPNTPYNSGSLKNMVAKVRTYCNKILPLVFDNTLSYYESICAFSAKVNELCDAVNAQNLTIVEFTHEVEIELDRFEKYIQEQYDTISTRVNKLVDDVNELDARQGTLENVVSIQGGRITNVETGLATANSNITDIQNNLTTIQGVINDIRLNIDILVNAINQKVGWSDVVNSVLEGDTHPVTSGAVYDAIEQGGGGGGFVPDATTSSKGIVQIGDNINVNAGVISVPSATTSSKGAVQIGDNITVSNGEISVPDATHLVKGAVKVGDNIDVSNGEISVPRATNLNLGVVTPGAGLSVNPVTPGVMSLNTATENVIGGVKVGDNLSVENDGTLSVPEATTNNFGVVKVGENLTIDSNDELVVKDAQPSLVKGAVTIDAQNSNLTLLNGVLDVPTGTKNNKGVLQVGDNLTVNGGVVDVPNATPTSKGVVGVESLDSGLSVVSGQLKVNNGDTLYFTNLNKLEVKRADDTLGGYGVVAPKLNGGIKATNGEIELKDATTQAIGGVYLTNTITDGDTTHVPTADAVYDAITGQTPPQIADATRNSKGIVQIGDNLEVSNGLISVPQASRLARGVVKVGSNLTVDSTDGTINVPTGSSSQPGILQVGSNLTDTNGVVDVPTATDSTKGILSVDNTNGLTISSGVLGVQPATHGQWGVAKIGSNLNVDQYGVVDLAPADASNLGGVKVGDNLNVNSAGLLSVPDATSSSKGVIRAGSNLTVNNGVLSVPYADSSTYGVVNTTTSITSGSSAVPTSGAVYQAIQGAGVNRLNYDDITSATISSSSTTITFNTTDVDLNTARTRECIECITGNATVASSTDFNFTLRLLTSLAYNAFSNKKPVLIPYSIGFSSTIFNAYLDNISHDGTKAVFLIGVYGYSLISRNNQKFYPAFNIIY